MRDEIEASVLSLKRNAGTSLPATPLRNLARRYKGDPDKLERLTEFSKMLEHSPIEAAYTYPVISFRFACGITRLDKADSETFSAEEFERAVYENKTESAASTGNAEGLGLARLWAGRQIFKAMLVGVFLGGATALAYSNAISDMEWIALIRKLEIWGAVIAGASIATDALHIALKESSSLFKKNPPGN
jgi:hypothetical protein